jgi:hypothetical protein
VTAGPEPFLASSPASTQARKRDGERTGELVDDVDLVLTSKVVDQAGDDATEIECHAVDASRYLGGPK